MIFLARFASGLFLAAAISTASPTWAQNRLDADSMRVWGGTYSSNCGNATAPLLRVTSSALIVEQGNKRLTGDNVQAAHSFFGNSPPPDYQVALVSEVKRKHQMLFVVYKDRNGLYIKVDGDREVTNALGQSLTNRTYRSCDGARRTEAPPPPPAPVTSAAAPGEPMVNPWDLLNDAKFKSAYYKALGHRANEPWLRALDGPATPTTKMRVAGNEYIFAKSCKNHDCGDNNLVLLYSPTQGKVYGKVFDRRRASLIGDPPSNVAAELDRLWAVEWRQNR